MKLCLCTSCNQHILNGEVCPYCQKPSTSKLTIPIAIMLGLGCNKNGTQPSPEVMALYGGPPVEIQEVEAETDDTSANEIPSKEDDAGKNKEPSQDEQQSEESPTTETANETTPLPVEGTIKALYGVESAPIELDK